MSNLLHKASSPYLIQHQDNPVHWQEWGDAAFAQAARRDVPVFLSIGYATCHWCHVMAHESFEDVQVAELLNRDYVSVKVDREERPDIDAIYMKVCQMMTGHGGWPLTIIMTPDRRPFFAATYIPREDRGGRYGMKSLLPAIAAAWRDQRQNLLASASQIIGNLEEHSLPGRVRPDVEAVAVSTLKRNFDSSFGGMSRAPKFPTPHNYMLLLRQYSDPLSLEIARRTARAMIAGGIHDHVGGGFHRYSTDREWHLPHFEKMLYDQAMIALFLSECWQRHSDPVILDALRGTLDFVLRDMRHPDGAFYSAYDADSADESGHMEEGYFYIYSWEVLRQALTPGEFSFVTENFIIHPEGNFADESSRRPMPYNILSWKTAPEPPAEYPAYQEQWPAIQEKLRNFRSGRAWPLLDDKILTDWNGLMIAALARAAFVLDDQTYLDAALRAWNFLNEQMTRPAGGLWHRYRGSAGIDGNLDDYAFMGWAGLELYRATGSVAFLHQTLRFVQTAVREFAHPDGGFYLAPARADLISRTREVYDGATPSGNSVMAWVMVNLSILTGDEYFRKNIYDPEKLFAAFAGDLNNQPSAHSMMIMAWRLFSGYGRELVLTGGSDLFLPAARTMFAGETLLVRGAEEPFHVLMEGRPAHASRAYLCENQTCQNPVSTPVELQALLESRRIQ